MEFSTEQALVDPSSLRQALAGTRRDTEGADLLQSMRQRLVGGREALRAYFEAGGSAEVVHHELARQMDGLIQGGLDFADRELYAHPNPDHRRAAGGDRGRRLRPGRAGAGLRHRPALPAPLQAHADGRAAGRVPALQAVGSRPEGRPGDALRGRIDQAGPAGSQRADRPARDAFRLGQPAALRRACGHFRARHRRRPRCGVHRGQARRARCPPPARRRFALPARAQHQGGQGRPARPAHPDVDRQVPVPGAGRQRAGALRRAEPAGAQHLPQLAALPVDGALPPALADRAARGAADLRPAARDRQADGLPRPARARSASSAS